MQYRNDKYGNPISVLGYGCLRFTKKSGKIEFEKAEQERIEAELKEKKDTLISSITKSGHITKEEIESSEELKGFVDALDEKSLKAVLADRYIASLSENTTEVSETENETETASTNLDGLEDEQMNVKSIMKD